MRDFPLATSHREGGCDIWQGRMYLVRSHLFYRDTTRVNETTMSSLRLDYPKVNDESASH
jgi:hypothetical protein